MLAVRSGVPPNTTGAKYEMFGIANRKVASTCDSFVWWRQGASEHVENDRPQMHL